jgi:hypothetical protein
MKFREYLNEVSEFVKLKDIDMQALYNKYNAKLFDSKLPKIEIKLSRMKDATGKTIASVIKDKRKNIVEVKNIEMKISTVLKLSMEEFEKIFIHEMIHVYFIHNKMNVVHGAEFKDKAREISNIVGMEIPITHDVSNSYVDDELPEKELSFLYSLESKGKPKIAFYSLNKKSELPTIYERMKNRLPKKSILAIGTIKTSLGAKYPIFRSTKAIKVVTITADESKSILDNAKIIQAEEIS